MKTMIDLFRRGNQELFHSAIVGWLPDSREAHGYGDQFIRAFAEEVTAAGYPLLQMEKSLPLKVGIEVPHQGVRPDIESVL